MHIKDLINNNEIDYFQNLVDAYKSAVSQYTFRNTDELRKFLVIVDIAVKHLKSNHDNLSDYWKAFTIIMLKKLLEKLIDDTDIINYIEEFLEYHKSHYAVYVDDLAWSSSDFDRDYGFVMKFVNNYKV